MIDQQTRQWRRPQRRLFLPLLLTFVATLLLAAAPLRSMEPPGAAQNQALTQAPEAPLDTPFLLVPEGVSDYHLESPKLFWHTTPLCQPTVSEPETPSQNYTDEIISRIATYGSPIRQLFFNQVSGVCGQQNLQIGSNIAADEDYVYWVNQNGLVRLSTDANVGDTPEILSAQVTGSFREVADDDDNVYALNTGNGQIWKVSKSDGAATHIVTAQATPSNLSAADGTYIYWLDSGDLKRYTIDAPSVKVIDSGVSGYHAEGRRLFLPSVYTHYVFYSKGHQVFRYDNISDTTSVALYTAADSDTIIHTMTTDFTGLYFFEAREVACGAFICYQDVLRRTSRGGGPVDTLHAYAAGTLPGAFQAHRLTTDGALLFWRDGGLQRLPNDAEAMPEVNLQITDVELTQAVQDTANSVPLIAGKRTFVRVHVQADGADVPGVTALLDATWDGGAGLAIPPANPVGTIITVKASPDRNNLNDSFLFELPWDWIAQDGLELQISVNPYQLPLEPNFADNDTQAGPLTFVASPRLEVQFISWGYELSNQIWWPRFVDDVMATYSWIRRAYPLSSFPGSVTYPGPGFRASHWYIFDQGLGSRVSRTHPDCLAMDEDLRNLCASAYTNTKMNALRSQWGVPAERFLYGFISDQAGFFPRGQACCGEKVSTGPAGPAAGWDSDTTYADWYAGHEIGHTLGRAHPVPAGDDPNTEVKEGCGHSRSDPGYPYAGAYIGPGNGIWGFDAGDPAFGIARAVYPDTLWRDFMSYCPYEWVSDYTYKGMYNFMTASALQPAVAPAAPRQGDLLSVFGIIIVGGAEGMDSAIIQHLRRVEHVEMPPLLEEGPYSIRLLSAAGDVLADYPFMPQEIHDSEGVLQSFGQVVDWADGAAQVQIVRLADGDVLASQGVSANPPTVDDVMVVDAAGPLTGMQTVEWTAGEPDGDALSFDLLYSDDGGSAWQLLRSSLMEQMAEVDANQLPGGPAVFRVVATDGVHSAQAESPAYVIEVKPPRVRILTPADEIQIHWGQLVNFSAEAEDLQDGTLSGPSLLWRNGDGEVLGSGNFLSSSDLPVGVNEITVSATNSEGLTGSDTVTVIVDDDLSLPGPTLTAAPMQMGWHVAEGTTAQQTASVIIHNGGAGDLSWEAAVDAGWLTLSASSGNTPATLTLMADPAGVASGETLVATLTLTNPDAPEQTLSIPVSLTAGSAYDPAGYLEPSYLYLPVAVRP